jgi:hypothetical protein
VNGRAFVLTVNLILADDIVWFAIAQGCNLEWREML